MKHFLGFLLLSSLGFVVSPSQARFTSTFVAARQDTATVLLCTGPYATKYHNHVCNGLLRCKADQVRVRLTDAQQKGFQACKWCFKY
jgi:hypothetical protein